MGDKKKLELCFLDYENVEWWMHQKQAEGRQWFNRETYRDQAIHGLKEEEEKKKN